MDAGKFAEACPKLEESQRLDPGTGTLLNLGRCFKESGKPASAWVIFNQAVASARAENRADRVALAQSEIKKLEETMPRLSVVVPPEADVPGLTITLDDATISQASRGVASPVDPGEHRISAAAPGRKTWTNSVAVRPGAQTHTVVIPVLEPGTDAAAPASASAAPAPGSAQAEPPELSDKPLDAPPQLAPGRKHWLLGFRINGAVPLGTLEKDEQGEPEKFADWTKAQGGLWLEGGYLITPSFMLGAYLVANFGGVGSVANSLLCQDGVSCSTMDVRLGLQGQYSFLPESAVHPWAGAGIGYEVWQINIEQGGQSGSLRTDGAEWLLLQGGADFELGPMLLGPFMALSFARFTSGSASCDNCDATLEFDIEKPAFHEWLSLGVRGAFKL